MIKKYTFLFLFTTIASFAQSDHIWLEAECAQVGADWNLVSHSNASNDEYLNTQGATVKKGQIDADNTISFVFEAEGGVYAIFGRVNTPTTEDDSFWFRVNGGPWDRWNRIPTSTFDWHQIHFKEQVNQPLTFTLPPGINTLEIAQREDGTGLDKVYITNSGNTPSGFGDPDPNCAPSNQRPFIFSFKTRDGYGVEGLTLSIPIDSQYQYNYDVDWGDGTGNESVTGATNHTYTTGGTYVVTISGDFPRPFLPGDGSCDGREYEILQWGDQKWQNLESAFVETILRLEAADIPDLSECSSVRNMFKNSGMTGNGMVLIPQWDMSGFTDLSGLFHGTAFNEDISHWDVSQVTDMSFMFSSGTLGCGDSPLPLGGAFNQDISSWDVSNVENMEGMFNGSPFNWNISSWDVSRVTNMRGMFADSKFNQDISSWDVSQVTDMAFMFSGDGYGELDIHFGSDFNQPLNDWNVTNVTDMSFMFNTANNFNQPLNDWDVSNVTDMKRMFFAARKFNQNIGTWNVSKVTDMSAMFSDGFIINNSDQYAFNQSVGGWDVSNVTAMAEMFRDAVFFDQDIGNWDVSKVTTMAGMFRGTNTFNQDISSWDVSQVTQMRNMFLNASVFDQDLGQWDVSNVASSSITSFQGMYLMFANSGLSNENYDNTLIGWSQLPSLQNGVQLDAPQNQYCDAELARQDIIDTYGWTINDAGLDPGCSAGESPFVTTWWTDSSFGGVSGNDQVIIPTHPDEIYDYTVDWGDGTVDIGVMGDITHTYDVPGTYTISINGVFPRIFFNNAGDKDKIRTIEQWGDIEWTSMENAFYGCQILSVDSEDAPDLSQVSSLSGMFQSSSATGSGSLANWNVQNISDMSFMFSEASVNIHQLSTWNVSNVENMEGMFRKGHLFFGEGGEPGSIANWDVSNVRNMSGMFWADPSIGINIGQSDIDLGSWDVSNVEDMSLMFLRARDFNQDISGWDVSKVTNMQAMFLGAWDFNQDIGNWDVSQVTNMFELFEDARSFDQDLGDWNVSQVTDMRNMLIGTALSTENYDATLTGWANLGMLQQNVILDAGAQYCESLLDRLFIMETFGWQINDEGRELSCIQNPSAFVTTWNSANQTFGDNQITIPTFPGETYNYTVDWGDGTTSENVSGDITHTYPVPGIFTVSITGDFPRFYSEGFDSFQHDIVSVDQWGSNRWSSMESAFAGVGGLIVKAIDFPDLTEVTDMSNMFRSSISSGYIQGIEFWDVSNVTNMSGTFSGSHGFDQDIGAWNVSSVTNMSRMFSDAFSFNQDIGAWDVSNVTDMSEMFSDAFNFNQYIGAWDVSNVTNMRFMFYEANQFNQDIGDWDVSNVLDMASMFGLAVNFNHDIGNWDVSNVENMGSMFDRAVTFNQDIGNWNVSKVTQMGGMFQFADRFNKDIGDWNVSSVTSMGGMFERALDFNQDIGNWDVSNVTNMAEMFDDAASFNQNIGNWDVSNVIFISGMFSDAQSFNQDLGQWNISQVINMIRMFTGSDLSDENYDNTLIGWSQLPSLQNGVQLDAPQNRYCNAELARQFIIDTYGWTINDAGKNCPANPNEIWLEAECAVVGSDWTVVNDPGASGDQYVAPPSGPTLKKGQIDADATVTFNFTASAGTYEVYGLVSTPSTTEDSFWVRMNGGPWTRWNAIPGGAAFSWHQVHNGENPVNIITYTLAEGMNTLEIAYREDGTGLDKVYITSTGTPPVGTGGTDTSCTAGSKTFVSVEDQDSLQNEVHLTPNPVITETSIDFDQPVQLQTIHVFDIQGRLVKTLRGHEAMQGQQYLLNVTTLPAGTYFLKLEDVKGAVYDERMVIQR